MKKNWIKYTFTIILLIVVAYNSVYFKKLDEVKAASTSKQFDAVTYAANFYNKKLLPNLSKAVDISTLLSMVQTEPTKAFTDYSHALGIGNIRYFLVKGKGTVYAVEDDAVTIALNSDTTKLIKITTEFVYGNAIRDASGLININEFNSTMDFNNVSAEMNKIIRTTVVPPFRTAAKPGAKVQFSGAIELNQAHINTENLEVVPISLNVVNG